MSLVPCTSFARSAASYRCEVLYLEITIVLTRYMTIQVLVNMVTRAKETVNVTAVVSHVLFISLMCLSSFRYPCCLHSTNNFWEQLCKWDFRFTLESYYLNGSNIDNEQFCCIYHLL